jgi:hypothetical protein
MHKTLMSGHRKEHGASAEEKRISTVCNMLPTLAGTGSNLLRDLFGKPPFFQRESRRIPEESPKKVLLALLLNAANPFTAVLFQ